MILGGCGSPRTTAVGDASLEQGIVSFIDGDLDHAESFFLKVTRESRSDADLQTAYLYLGRIYLARGDYVKSADALSAGKAHGGDVRFDEFFEEAQRHLIASPARSAQLERITRRQLAALAVGMFGSRLEAAPAADGANGPGEARDPLDVLVGAGVLDVLPDGEAHPDDPLTRPAFYAAVSRLARALGADDGAERALLDGGYRGAVGAAGTAQGNFITGREAVGMLQALDAMLGDAKDD